MKRKIVLLLPIITMLCSCGTASGSNEKAKQITSYSTSLAKTSFIDKNIEYTDYANYKYINTYIVGLLPNEVGKIKPLYVCECGKEAYRSETLADMNKLQIGDKVTIYQNVGGSWSIYTIGYWYSDTYLYWYGFTLLPSTSTSK